MPTTKRFAAMLANVQILIISNMISDSPGRMSLIPGRVSSPSLEAKQDTAGRLK